MLQKKAKYRRNSKKITLDNGVVVTYSRIPQDEINLPEKYKEVNELLKNAILLPNK